MRRWWTRRSRRTSTSGMRGDGGEADAAWYLLPSAFASVVFPLSRVRLSRVSAFDVPPGRFVCLFVCFGLGGVARGSGVLARPAAAQAGDARRERGMCAPERRRMTEHACRARVGIHVELASVLQAYQPRCWPGR
eukprot:931467-Prymnesium_polylepis.1